MKPFVWPFFWAALLIGALSACGPDAETDSVNLPATHFRVASHSARFHLYRYPLPGLAPSAIAPIDLFDRGIDDLVVANAGSSTLSLYRNRGDGTFEEFSELDSCPGGDSVSAEPLTGSGHDDILVTCQSASMLSLFTGDGHGNFVRHDLTVGASPIGAQSAPHSETSSTPYLAVLSDAPSALQLWFNHGNGRFVHERDLTVPGAPSQFLADTFTDDGQISYAVVSAAHSAFSVFLKKGQSYERTDYSAPEAADNLATIDLQGTGFNDLVIGSSTRNTFRIFHNDRTGHFPTSDEYSVPEGPGSGFGTSHLRGQPQEELLTESAVTGDLIFYPHLGNGKLGAPEIIHAGSALTGLVTGRFIHHSDDMDAAMIDTQTSELVILLNERADF